jgi:catechol-2,3-dioxygenase
LIRGLGEIALRVKDLATMKAFYKDVVGLEVFAEPEPYFVFFKVSELTEGHPQILGLFDRDADFGEERTRLDHFAFLIDLDSYEEQKQRLEELGVDVILRTFPYFHWRSLFFADPEGNTVELVSYDPDV